MNWSNFLSHPIVPAKGPGVRLEALLDAAVFAPWRAHRESRTPKDAGPKDAGPKDTGGGFVYRRRPSVFPGVRLAFSESGVSTTIGVQGAKMPAGNSWENSWGNSGENSRRSNSNSQIAAMTSEGLGELRELINEAARRRQELRGRIGQARSKLKSLELRLTLARFPILALFLSWTVDELRQAIADARAEIDAAGKALRLSIIDLTFDLDAPAEAAYTQLKFSFDHLSGCNRIWNVASSASGDRSTEGTAAASHVARTPVRVGRSTSAIINSPQDVLRFDTATGAPLLIYPGIAMTQEDGGNFALVDIRELNLRGTGVGFIEEAGVPSDTQVTGKTWKQVTKDGLRDLGFQNNYQIPIVRYGAIEFSSQAGIGGVYHFSNAEKAALFAADFEAFKNALSIGAKSSTGARVQDIATASAVEAPAIEPAGAQTWPEIPRKPTGLRLIADMSLLLACIALPIYFGLWSPSPQVAAEKLQPTGDMDQAIAAPATTELAEAPQSSAIAEAPVPDKASSKAPEEAAKKYMATVKLKRANVRADPKKSASIVATLKKGKTVMLLEQQGDWYRVTWGHDTGWMHRSTINLRDVPTLLTPQ